MKLKAHAVDKVGQWTPKDGLNVTDKYAFQHGKEMNRPIHTQISILRIEHYVSLCNSIDCNI